MLCTLPSFFGDSQMRLCWRDPIHVWVLALMATTVGLNPHDACRGADGLGDSDIAIELNRWVEQLDDPSYLARQEAVQRLISAADDRETSSRAAAALRHGLHHPSVEVRMASHEMLQEIEQRRHDGQVARLLNPRCEASTVELAAWRQFARLAGEDMAARRTFASLTREYPGQLSALHEQSRDRLRSIVEILDPYRLSPQDVHGWILLLLIELEHPQGIAVNRGPRIATALSNSALGPRTTSLDSNEVLRRLIDCWLRAPGSISARERLLIAMRYQCQATAIELCQQVLAEKSTPPSTLVTALLCGSALGRTDIGSQLSARLNDERTAHVWQLIAPRKAVIRTQVRDVALAVLLHQQGIDPREMGFHDLQADPVLVFRDHSLGFPDAGSRRATFERASELLSTPATTP